MKTETFSFEGHRIAYSDLGDGDRPLVLAHGLLMNRRMYTRLAAELAGLGHRVICIDLLGHGDSDAPADLSLYSMTAFAGQVAGLLDHLDLERA
ncbi:MAG: alpha/beta fold hydrolase, partial [Solirubrobacterales bacterium]|nr:alpha/beta fold hydrolase [Solirubrobacterales bacterium]